MRIGSLFSGAGGLDLAVQAVFGGEVVWHAEIDKAASKVLAHHWPDVPNLGDVSDINWDSVPPVDVLCGGFPCQDVSAAGRRAGIKEGTRSGLWSVFAEAIDWLHPRIVVIENVRGLLSAAAERTVDDGDSLEFAAPVMGNGTGRPLLRAAGAVLGDLADLGYDAQWATVAAADVGAPHRRERVFIVATDAAISSGAGLQQQDLSALRQQRGDRRPGQSGVCACGGAPCGCDAPHPSRDGWDQRRPESAGIVRGFDAAVSGDEPGRAFTVAHSGGAAVGEPAGSTSAEETRSQPGDRPGDCGGERTPRDGRQACGCGDRRIDHDWFANPDRFDDGGCRRCRCESFWPSDEPGVALLPTPRMDLRTTVTLLPTPNAQDGNGGGRYSSPGHQSTLPGEVRLLPTPRTSDTNGAGHHGDGGAGHHGDGGMDLRTTVTLLPTPKAAERGDCASEHRRNDPDLRAITYYTQRWGKYAPAIARWEQVTGQPALAPTEPNKNGNPRLSAAFSEWLMGWPPGWVTDPAIGISRNDQLRCVGNGVCPQQAAYALSYLLHIAQQETAHA